MTKAEFHNGLRLLRFVEPHKLELTVSENLAFETGPYSFFVKCDDAVRDRIWNEMYPEERVAKACEGVKR